MQQQDGANKKTNTSVEYNWEAPWTSFNQVIPTGQRCAFQPTEEDSGDAIDTTFYHRKGPANAWEGNGAAVSSGCMKKGPEQRPGETAFSVPIPAQIPDLQALKPFYPLSENLL